MPLLAITSIRPTCSGNYVFVYSWLSMTQRWFRSGGFGKSARMCIWYITQQRCKWQSHIRRLNVQLCMARIWIKRRYMDDWQGGDALFLSQRQCAIILKNAVVWSLWTQYTTTLTVVLHRVTKHCSDTQSVDILHLNWGYSFKPHAPRWRVLHVESLYTYVKCSWDSDVWWMWLIMVDMARHPRELLRKEAIHIQMTPAEERLNRDTGLELPGCWVAALRRQEDSTNRAGPPPTERLRANGDRRWCGAQA